MIITMNICPIQNLMSVDGLEILKLMVQINLNYIKTSVSNFGNIFPEKHSVSVLDALKVREIESQMW